jgi:hypothetical protein
MAGGWSGIKIRNDKYQTWIGNNIPEYPFQSAESAKDDSPGSGCAAAATLGNDMEIDFFVIRPR